MFTRPTEKPQIDRFGKTAPPAAIVAIPACNEAARIERCLAALAMQRDGYGAPVPQGAFGVLLLANNCTDATAEIARRMAADLPYPLWVHEQTLPAASATPRAVALR